MVRDRRRYADSDVLVVPVALVAVLYENSKL
jgi:hypothetical protein